MTRSGRAIVPAVTIAVLLVIGGIAWASAGGPPEQETADVLTFAELAPVEDATAWLTRGEETLATRTDTRDLDHRHVS